MISWLQRGVQAVLDVFWRTSTFFHRERRWTHGLGYNVVFTGALQLVAMLVLVGAVSTQGTVGFAAWPLLGTAILQPVYVAFATLLWAAFMGVSLAAWTDASFTVPSWLLGSLFGVTVVGTAALNASGQVNVWFRSLTVFGSWLAWMAASYGWLWTYSSWFEDVLAVAQYSWLAAYPYTVVNSAALVTDQLVGASAISRVVSALFGAAAIVHIIVASVYGVCERYDLSLLGGAVVGIVGPVLIVLGLVALLSLGALAT